MHGARYQRGLPEELVAGALAEGFDVEVLEVDGAVLELVAGAFAEGAGVWPAALEVGGASLVFADDLFEL